MARRALGPASLAVAQAVAALEPGPWLVACSGGADSLALAWAAARVAGRRGTPVRAVVVDHGLQEGSDAVAARTAAVLAARGLPAGVVRASVAASTAGPEASAREARYAALEAAHAPGETVLLGHTLDDQAETVLLGLARGSGTRSLAGMPPRRGVFARPLLGLRRTTTAACCAEQGLDPWSDPHNADPAYARVRVRTRVLPVLEAELGPGVAEALARTAALARADADALDALAAAAAPGGEPAADDPSTGDPHCGHLAGLDRALRTRRLRAWLEGCGVADLSASHLDAVERLVVAWHGQRGVDVPGGRVVRVEGRLQLRPLRR